MINKLDKILEYVVYSFLLYALFHFLIWWVQVAPLEGVL